MGGYISILTNDFRFKKYVEINDSRLRPFKSNTELSFILSRKRKIESTSNRQSE